MEGIEDIRSTADLSPEIIKTIWMLYPRNFIGGR
jgi:hypothetical protein